jgi:acetyl-CoA synthetase
MATEQKQSTGDELERELGGLLDTEKLDPPEEFRKQALIKDDSVFEEAANDLEGWWAKQAEELHWFEKWDQVLDESDPPFYKWFVGGKINVSYNCLDRHVEDGNGDRVAFHWRGEEGDEKDLTYADLLGDVQRFANALKDLEVKKGDVVGIYLPMIPEVIVAMLACARIGAIHNVVFGGFSADSVKERMEFSQAKALITVDGAARKGKTAPVKEKVDEVMGDLESLEKIIVVKSKDTDCEMKDGRDVWFHEIMEAADAECEAEPMDAEDPLYILYTSGSTAKPKGILHTTGGYLTGVAATHRMVFDLHPEDDVFWCSADVGWVTGHSYIVYGPLANGATSVMYEGAPDYPHKGIWWELCERYKVTKFYTAPTAIRACIKWGADHPNKYNLDSLKLLGTVGEPINPKAWLWYYKVIGHERCPIVDTWWQTETGAIMITTLPGVQHMKPGSAGTPLPGIEADVVDEKDGKPLDSGQGLLVLKRPWPSMLRTLYKEEDRFIETYFDRFGKDTYLVGDAARKDQDDGYFWVIGRIDDVVNVSGHRMSTAEVESAIVAHSDVAEAAVIGQSDEDSGQAITAFVTLQGDQEGTDEIVEAIRETVAKRIGKLARPKRIIWADDLPKTRSGKIMRRLLRDIAEGRELGDVTTLRDPDVMGQLEGKIKERQDEEE